MVKHVTSARISPQKARRDGFHFVPAAHGAGVMFARSQQVLKIEERPWKATIAAVMITVGMAGGAAGIIPIVNDGGAAKAVILASFSLVLVYLLINSVWKRSILIDSKGGLIRISERCPYLFSPATIRIDEMFQVGVRNWHIDNSRGFVLVFKTKQGEEYYYGDGSDSDEGKYLSWCSQINDYLRDKT